MERYEAKDRANMDVNEFPATAFAIACSIAQVVNTLVGRPMHVAMVKGLNRNLLNMSTPINSIWTEKCTLLQWHSYSIFCLFLGTCKASMIQPHRSLLFASEHLRSKGRQ